MKVVECLLFYNEVDMLYYHLLLMYPYVSHFVIAESMHTFRGNPKESFYIKHFDRFKPFADKIVHKLLDVTPLEGAWDNERAQRLQFAPALAELQLAPSDFVFILDVDEIINPLFTTLLRIHGARYQGTWHVPTDMYYYRLETKLPHLWRFTMLTTYGCFLTTHCGDGHQIRIDMISNRHPELSLETFGVSNVASGWHMSYWGDAAWIQNKLRQFSHTEFSGDAYTNAETIERHRLGGTNMFTGERLNHLAIPDNPRLPPLLRLDNGTWFPCAPPL